MRILFKDSHLEVASWTLKFCAVCEKAAWMSETDISVFRQDLLLLGQLGAHTALIFVKQINTLDRSHRTLLPASKAAQAWHKSSSFLSIFTILVILGILCSLSPSAPDHGHKANAEKRSRKAGQVGPHADVPRLHGFRVRGQLPTFGLISRRACMEMPGRPFTTSRSGAKQDPPPHPETPRPQSSLLLAQAHFLHLSTFSRQEGVRDRMGRLFRAALLAANYDSWQLSAIQDLPFCLISTNSDPSHLDNS